MLATVGHFASSIFPSYELKCKSSSKLISTQDSFAIATLKATCNSYLEQSCQINHLPDELLASIFDHLSIRDQMKARQVCRRWNRLAFSNTNQLFIGRVFTKMASTYVDESKQVHCDNSYNAQQAARFLLQQTNRRLKRLHLHRIDFNAFTVKDRSDSCQQSIKNHRCSNEIDSYSTDLNAKKASCPNLNSSNPSIDFNSKSCHAQAKLQAIEACSAVNLNQLESSSCVVLNDNLASLITRQCVNLSSLTLSHCGGINSQIVSMLLQSFGSNLYEFRLRQTYDLDLVSLFFKHLNAKKLTKLSLFVDQESLLERICQHFPLLEDLEVLSFTPLSFAPLRTLNHLKSFRLRNNHSGVGDLNQLLIGNTCRTLQSLRMNGMLMCTAVQMQPLRQLESLEHLQLVITDNSQLQFVFHNLIHLKSLDLCLQLYPRQNRLSQLSRLQQLHSLRIKCHNINLLRLEELPAMPALRSLSLLGRYFCQSMLDAGQFLRILPIIFPNLHYLELTDQWSFPKSLIRCLINLKHLKELRLMVDQEKTEMARHRLQAFCHRMKITLICCTRRTSSSFSITNRYNCLVPKSIYTF